MASVACVACEAQAPQLDQVCLERQGSTAMAADARRGAPGSGARASGLEGRGVVDDTLGVEAGESEADVASVA